MTIRCIFSHDSHIEPCWVNVIYSPYSERVYFGHQASDRETSERARRVVEQDSEVKVLYRVRVKLAQGELNYD